MQVYLVGGAVRDELLGRPVTERDWVVVGATPAEMEAAGYRAVGRDFPVYLHPETHEEYALARLERKVAPGYRGFTTQFSPQVSLQEDLGRRDLTINAMARGGDGALIDPYGGRQDLEQRRLRHVSAAFSEDPVRILRTARFAARFASLGFHVAPETLTLMRSMVAAGEAAATVPERLWREMERALAESNPGEFFTVLQSCDALAVLLPEITLDEEALQALTQAVPLSADSAVRFASLLASTALAQRESLCRRLRIPNEYRELALLDSRLHARVAAADTAGSGQLLEVLESADALRRPQRFLRLLLSCEARGIATHALERLRAAQQAAAGVVLDPSELAGKQGADIAAALRARRLAAIDSKC